jgi:hypothetical protein
MVDSRKNTKEYAQKIMKILVKKLKKSTSVFCLDGLGQSPELDPFVYF